MNKKGFATSTIVFALLSVFLISISILLVTITNTNRTKNALNEKVVSNIEYGNSSINDIEQRLEELENNTLKIDDIYPIGSVYISTTDDTIEKVQKRFGGTWEKYSEGRTIIGDGTTTDESGNALVYNANQTGGNVSTILNASNIPNLSVTGTTDSSGQHTHLTQGFVYEDSRQGTLPAQTMAWLAGTYQWQTVPIKGGDQIFSGSTNVSGYHEHTFIGNYKNDNIKGVTVQDPYIVTYIYKRVK